MMFRAVTLAIGSLLLEFTAATDADGLAFLAKKEKEEGVIKLPSGLLYKVLEKGSGTKHPKSDTPCDIDYRGKLISGVEFDSSYARGVPSVFTPDQVIDGWTEAMEMMVVGDNWELYIPSELAYGDQTMGTTIPPRAALQFQLKLLHIREPSTDF